MIDISIQVQHRNGEGTAFPDMPIPPIGSWVECYSTRDGETGDYNPDPKARPSLIVSGRVYDIHYEHTITGTGSSTYHSGVIVVVLVEDGEAPEIV